MWSQETQLVTRRPTAPHFPREKHVTPRRTGLCSPSGATPPASSLRAGEPRQTGTGCAPSHARNFIRKPQAVHKAHFWKKIERFCRPAIHGQTATMPRLSCTCPGEPGAAPRGARSPAAPAALSPQPHGDQCPRPTAAPSAGCSPGSGAAVRAAGAGGLCGCSFPAPVRRTSSQNTNSCL